MSEDVVNRLYRALVDALRERGHPPSEPILVRDLYEELIPYREVRPLLGVELNADYEHALLRLLAGEGGLVRLEPESAREELRREVEAPYPVVGLFRKFAGASVRVTVPGEPAAPAGPQPEAPAAVPDASAESVPEGPADLRPGDFTGRPPDAPAESASDAPLDRRSEEPTERSPEPSTELSPEPPTETAAAPPTAPPTEPAPEESAPEESAPEEPAARSTDLPEEPTAARRSPEPSASPTPLVEPEGAGEGERGDGEESTRGGAGRAGAVACAFCGGSLPADRPVRFCPHCGENQTFRPCPRCGTVLEEEWRYCIRCGEQVRQN